MTQRKVVRLRQHEKQQVLIAGGYRFDENGLTLIREPVQEEFADCFDQLMAEAGSIHFWIGDLLAFGINTWGESDVEEMVKSSGYDWKTLRKLGWVATSIESARRRPALSFSHHQDVAALPVHQQELLLNRAEAEAWPSKRIRHEVHALAHEMQRPSGPALPSALHNTDARNVLSELPDGSVDLAIVDPTDKESNSQLGDVLELIADKLKPNSHLYVFAKWPTYRKRQVLIERHYDLHNVLVWIEQERPVTQGMVTPLSWQIFFAHKGRRHLNGSRDGNVLYYPGAENGNEKPVALLQYLVEKSSQPGEIVLVPFMGTGVACEAAARSGRGYVGSEPNCSAYRKAQQRLQTVGAN